MCAATESVRQQRVCGHRECVATKSMQQQRVCSNSEYAATKSMQQQRVCSKREYAATESARQQRVCSNREYAAIESARQQRVHGGWEIGDERSFTWGLRWSPIWAGAHGGGRISGKTRALMKWRLVGGRGRSINSHTAYRHRRQETALLEQSDGYCLPSRRSLLETSDIEYG
jgi:hypothetical protein